MEEEEKHPDGAGRYEEKWSAWLGELRDFKREHGHCNVPGRPAGLGNWVSKQRSARRHGWNTMTPRRIRALDEEGFSWEAPRRSRRPRPAVTASARLRESHADGAPMEEKEEEDTNVGVSAGIGDAPMEEGEDDPNVEWGGAGIGEVADPNVGVSAGIGDAPMQEGEEDPNVKGVGASIGKVAERALGDDAAPARPGGNKDEGNASKISFSMRHMSSSGEEEDPPKRMGELEGSAEPEGVPASELGHAVEPRKREMERRLSDFASVVEDLKKMHSEGLRGVREEYEGRLASLRGELEDVRGELREAREHATSLQSVHRAQVADLKKMHSEGLRGAREGYEGWLISLRGEYEGQLRTLREELREARGHVAPLQGQLLEDPEVCVSL